MSDGSDTEAFDAELGNVLAEEDNWQGFDFEPRRQDYLDLYENEWGSTSNTTDSGSEAHADDWPEEYDYEVENGNTDWCLCGNCSPMPTRAERICCQEIEAVKPRCQEMEEGLCVTSHPDFIAFTSRVILENTLWVIHHTRNDPFNVDDPKSLRWAAFKQFTAWIYGRLGHRVRRVIPSCAVTSIREQYPNAPGEGYTGFRDAMDVENIFE